VGLQERLLSLFIVHFSDDELHWECLTKPATETGVDFGSNILHYEKAYFMAPDTRDSYKGLSHNALNPRITVGVAKDWHKTVQEFTRVSLTFNKDKLPTLQRVAKRVQTRRQCTYYAGFLEGQHVYRSSLESVAVHCFANRISSTKLVLRIYRRSCELELP
jgi:hypothetical protein